MTASEDSKYLDTEKRFGYLRRNTEARCRECQNKIHKDDSRVYDNSLKVGPYCIGCARRIAILPDPKESDRKYQALIDVVTTAVGEAVAQIKQHIEERCAQERGYLEIELQKTRHAFSSDLGRSTVELSRLGERLGKIEQTLTAIAAGDDSPDERNVIDFQPKEDPAAPPVVNWADISSNPAPTWLHEVKNG